MKWLRKDGLLTPMPQSRPIPLSLGLTVLVWLYSSCVLPATEPFAHTRPATYLRPTSATLNGIAVPNGSPTTAWFEWGGNDSYGQQTPPVDIGSGDTLVRVSTGITGLTNRRTLTHARGTPLRLYLIEL